MRSFVLPTVPDPTYVLTRAIYLDIGARRYQRTVDVVLLTAFLLSIVHYVDNTLRFDDYSPDPG